MVGAKHKIKVMVLSVWRGAAEASDSGGAERVRRGNAVGLTSILDLGQFF